MRSHGLFLRTFTKFIDKRPAVFVASVTCLAVVGAFFVDHPMDVSRLFGLVSSGWLGLTYIITTVAGIDRTVYRTVLLRSASIWASASRRAFISSKQEK